MAGHDQFPCSQPAVPSHDGTCIAVIDRAQLLIRSSHNGTIEQSYELPPGFGASCRFIRWYRPLQRSGRSLDSDRTDKRGQEKVHDRRLLLADDARIMVFDPRKPQVYAEISGATNLTRLGNVGFGYRPDEVVVFSDFGYKLQIWSLLTKRAIEIKDPKHVAECYSYRRNTGHLALLTRPAAHDILMIIAPGSHEVVATHELPTIDARGIKYSPDSNWLAVWDTASAGCRVLLLTTDGHLFKSYSLPQEDLNLGVGCVQWSPTGDCLAVGDHEGKVTILGLRSFTPVTTFLHQSTIDSSREIVWQEEKGPSRTRSYIEAKQFAVSPPGDSSASAKEKAPGISLMEFNHDGTLLASRCNETPSTLRICSPRSGQPVATLIHHAPIRSMQWHTEVPDLLLVQCAIADPTVYAWRAGWSSPKVFTIPLKPPYGQFRASWLSSDRAIIRYMLSNTEQTAIGRFTSSGEECQAGTESLDGLGPEDMFDEGHSLDLSPVKMSDDGGLADDTPAVGLSTQLGLTSAVEDTFHYRREGQAVT